MWNWKLRKLHSLSEINRPRLHHLSLHVIETTGKMAFFWGLRKKCVLAYSIFFAHLLIIVVLTHIIILSYIHIFSFHVFQIYFKIISCTYEINLKLSVNWFINRKISVIFQIWLFKGFLFLFLNLVNLTVERFSPHLNTFKMTIS